MALPAMTRCWCSARRARWLDAMSSGSARVRVLAGGTSRHVVGMRAVELAPSRRGTQRPNFSKSSSCHCRQTLAGARMSARRTSPASHSRRSAIPAEIVLPEPDLVGDEPGARILVREPRRDLLAGAAVA